MQNLTIHIYLFYVPLGSKKTRDQGWTIHIILLLQIKKTLDKKAFAVYHTYIIINSKQFETLRSFFPFTKLCCFLSRLFWFCFRPCSKYLLKIKSIRKI